MSIFIVSQPVNKQIGINKVVNNKKNNEIPSTPIGKFKFKIGIQKNLFTNWKVPIDLLKNTQTNKDKTNVKQEKLNATCLNKIWFDEGIGNNAIAPVKGSNKIYNNKFLIHNIT